MSEDASGSTPSSVNVSDEEVTSTHSRLDTWTGVALTGLLPGITRCDPSPTNATQRVICSGNRRSVWRGRTVLAANSCTVQVEE